MSRSDAYDRAVLAVRDRVARYVERVYVSGGLSDADVARFVKVAVPVVLAGRRQVSALTDAYLSAALSDVLPVRVRPVGPIDTDALRGVPDGDVYRRPYVTAWRALGEGAPLEVAVAAGVRRLVSIAATDLQMAKVRTAQRVLSAAPGDVRYVRALVGADNCGLCVVASTMLYRKDKLMPIHPGCNCGVRIAGPGDDGESMDAVLASAHGAIADTFGVSDSGARAVDYRKILLTREHGEIGPVLTVKGHRFTGPGDIAA